MEDEERRQYLEKYYDNEADANRKMSFANAFGGGFMFVIWMLYVTRVFMVADRYFIPINIIFPITIFILFSPLFYLRTKAIRKPQYKFFLVFSFLFVVTVINVLLPKHGILAWGLCIVGVNHYYNPKFGRVIFGTTLFLMLLCLYVGMFLGEYAPDLLGEGIIKDGAIYWPGDPKERYDMLHEMLLKGENRYLKVFAYYYLPRAGILTLTFLVSDSLNRRTYNLLVKELEVSRDQEKARAELSFAKEIQFATLPIDFEFHRSYEIQAELIPAKSVGGDFFDHVVLDEDHVAIAIGDVSGKGVPAAMFMMKTITALRNNLKKDKTPAQILSEVNSIVYQGNDSKMFVTVFLGILDVKTGKFVFANAGHNPPIIGKPGSYHFLNCSAGFVLAGMETAFVKDEEIVLEKGETIMLYTDGITEARNESGEFFGEKRLLELLNTKANNDLLKTHSELKNGIHAFVNKAPQSDDITYISLLFRESECDFVEKELLAKKENVAPMLEVVSNFAKKNSLPSDFSRNLLVVVDELLSNVAKYAYTDELGSFFLRLSYSKERKDFQLTIADRGNQFNPFEHTGGAVQGEAAEIKEGGLGILLVTKMMDECVYDYVKNKNIINLRKRFDK